MKLARLKTKRFSRRSRVVLTLIIVTVAAAGSFLVGTHFYSKPGAQPHGTPPKLAKAGVDGTKKSEKEKLNYDVPANRPWQLAIDKLGIDANILPMGILDDGSLEAPKGAWDVGWYDQSALPGSGENALLIDGHVNDALGTPGIFYKIHSLQRGDIIKIQRGDKRTFSYEVVKVEQKPIENVDMAKMLRSSETGKEGVNLITCGGEYDNGRQTYKDRILVYAVRTT